MPNFFSKLLSHGADKQLKELEAIAEKVNDFEPQIKALSDEELAALEAPYVPHRVVGALGPGESTVPRR